MPRLSSIEELELALREEEMLPIEDMEELFARCILMACGLSPVFLLLESDIVSLLSVFNS